MILHLHLVVCIYIGSYLEYNNCGLYAMSSTIAYKQPVLLLMIQIQDKYGSVMQDCIKSGSVLSARQYFFIYVFVTFADVPSP